MVTFPVTTAAGEAAGIEVFTTRPDTLFGATFMVLAPEHPLVDEIIPSAGWPEGTHEAVSYTHLDVYKRQVPGGRYCRLQT